MTAALNPVAAPCDAALVPAFIPAPSKAAQIIGGSSALDAVRARQETVPASHPLFAGAAVKPFEPAAAPMVEREACALPASAFTLSASLQPPSPSPALRPLAATPLDTGLSAQTVLGSRMVPIKRTAFDAQWQRVSASRTDLSQALALAGTRGASRSQIVAAVHRWVNREIAHVEDIELFGRSDFWAEADTTLRLGKGDCEDFALLKMELLSAAGIAREDMVLTLARDTIRRRDHAVLLVRDGDGWVMLDNVGSVPLDAAYSWGYRPVMSLGADQSWVHGY